MLGTAAKGRPNPGVLEMLVMRMGNTYSLFNSTERSSGGFEFPLRSAAVQLWSKQRECIVGYVAGLPTTFIVGHR